MTRIALGIEYDGSAYHGWQRQKHSPSVQQHVEEALSFVADEPVELVCAGRTDTGVHALEQVAHFDTSAERSERAWLLGGNCRLPRDIRLRWAQPVDAAFHARFSALARSYRYLILNDRVPSAVFHDKCCWTHQPLDAQRMQRAARALVGEHDFSSFRAAGCQARSPLRRVEYLRVRRDGLFVQIDIKANAFLHHMVRNIAGSLIAIGQGEQPEDWLKELLAARDRRLAAMTAPAGGLYFVRAFYPESFDLPQQERLPRLF
jgi:tRNA pseudouridine38-40 synthase